MCCLYDLCVTDYAKSDAHTRIINRFVNHNYEWRSVTVQCIIESPQPRCDLPSQRIGVRPRQNCISFGQRSFAAVYDSAGIKSHDLRNSLGKTIDMSRLAMVKFPTWPVWASPRTFYDVNLYGNRFWTCCDFWEVSCHIIEIWGTEIVKRR